MSEEATHCAPYRRSVDRRYSLKGKALLSNQEAALLFQRRATMAQILEMTREQLIRIYPECFDQQAESESIPEVPPVVTESVLFGIEEVVQEKAAK